MVRTAVKPARRAHVARWLIWVLVSVLGAVVGALAAWETRSLVGGGSGLLQQDLAYVATGLNVLISAGAQWLVLRRLRIDAYWWVPATIVAELVAVTFIVPGVFNLLYAQPSGSPVIGTAMFAGATALGAAGLLVGVVQSVVLRPSAGNLAWLWIPATALGGALAGALTSALSSQLLGLTPFATIGLVAAASGLLTAACQVPVFARIAR